MTTFNTIMDHLAGSEILAPVHAQPLFLENGYEIPNKKAIVRDDTGSLVSVVGKKYAIVQTETMVRNFAESIDAAGMDTNGIIIDHSVGANNIRNLVKVQFPEHTISLREGDNTDLQIVARNSFDGSWPFKIDVGGFRIACANGQVLGDYIDAFRARHTPNMSYDGIIPGLERSISMFEQAGHRWVEYRKTKMNKTQGEDVILDYMGKTISSVEDRTRVMERKSDRRDGLLEKLGTYGKDMGWNLLAAYNTLTDDATHHSTDATAQFESNKKLVRVIDAHHKLLAA